jgi:hypothetical protein
MELSELFSAPTIVAVLLATLALLAIFLIASAVAAWNEERARRAVAVVREGSQLRAGFGTFRGTAQNLDPRSGGELVRRSRTQASTQTPSGPIWRDVELTTAGRTFLLVLENGIEIEIEIEVDAEKPRLVGFEETTPGASSEGPGQRPHRVMIARVSAGDEIWATGVLARVPADGGGAYRSSVTRRTLRAPRRGELELSTESPIARWTAHAAAHKRGAYVALGALALLHGVFFRAVDRSIVKAASFAWETLATLPRYRLVVEIPAVLGVAIAVGAWIVLVRRARQLHPRG